MIKNMQIKPNKRGFVSNFKPLEILTEEQIESSN